MIGMQRMKPILGKRFTFRIRVSFYIKVHVGYTTFFLHHMTDQTGGSSSRLLGRHIGHMVNFDPFYGLADVTTK
jgi:hypothetical protein